MLAPRSGGVLTFGSGHSNVSELRGINNLFLNHPGEREFLLPGAINPASIDKLDVYSFNPNSRIGNLRFHLIKEITDEGIFVRVTNVESKITTEYQLNQSSGRFEPVDSST